MELFYSCQTVFIAKFRLIFHHPFFPSFPVAQGFSFHGYVFTQNKRTKKQKQKHSVKVLQYNNKKFLKTEIQVEIITFYILRERKNAAGSPLADGKFWSNIIKN